MTYYFVCVFNKSFIFVYHHGRMNHILWKMSVICFGILKACSCLKLKNVLYESFYRVSFLFKRFVSQYTVSLYSFLWFCMFMKSIFNITRIVLTFSELNLHKNFQKKKSFGLQVGLILIFNVNGTKLYNSYVRLKLLYKT